MYYLKLKGQPIETNYNKNNEERAERTQVNQPLTPVYFFWCFRWMSCCNSEIPTASPSAIAAKLSLPFQGDMTLEFLLTCPAWFHLFHFSSDLLTCKFSNSEEEMAFPRRHSDKESAGQCRRRKKRELDPWAGKIPWRRKRQPTPASLPGKSHGQRSLVGCGPWGRKESDTSEWLSARTHKCKHLSYRTCLCDHRSVFLAPFGAVAPQDWLCSLPLNPLHPSFSRPPSNLAAPYRSITENNRCNKNDIVH